MVNSVSMRTGVVKSSVSPMPRCPLPSISNGMVMVPLWLEAALSFSVSFNRHSVPLPDHFRYVLEGTGNVLNNADSFRQSQDDLRVFVIIEKRLRKFRIVEGCRRSKRCQARFRLHLLSGFYRPRPCPASLP